MRIPTSLLGGVLLACALLAGLAPAGEESEVRPHVVVRGIYGGLPSSLMEDGRTLADAGVNAVWIGERGITKERVEALRAQDARVFAEFNTLHRAEYLEEHPDAAPVGPDGRRAEAPHGWQGICPTHEAYRRWRMDAFRALLEAHDLDGVWLDYHHAHASWERADPALPDTCFCAGCLARFQQDTGIDLQGRTGAEASALLLGSEREAWIAWRCGVFTDWVREFREIRDEVRSAILLGTFHCPWSAQDLDGALRAKLAIDLTAQGEHLDVFSPMPYHARFGRVDDPAWISRQTAWLGEHLGAGTRIWPIVQLSDWGEDVPVEQVAAVLDHGTRPPATGVMVFAWGSLAKQPEKVEAMARFYRAIRGTRAPVELLFEPGPPEGRLLPRYSPKGFRVTLAPREEGAPEGRDALEGRLALGPVEARGDGHLVVLARSAEGMPYDRLWLDEDGDGSIEDETMRSASPRESRGNVYTSFDAVVRVAHDEGDEREPYGIGIWVAVESADHVPPFLRFSRRGYLVAYAALGEGERPVVLSDSNHDGVYGEGDWFAILDADGANDLSVVRRVGDFAWAGREAWRLELEGTRGRRGRLLPVDPGLTPQEDARRRDRLWDDKHAARAETPVAFRRDVDAAVEEAKAGGACHLLDFETVWCGPCKDMDRWVYTARDVAAAAEGIVCIKVDGDERKDLKERHGVQAFPTGILFGPDGEEIARFQGYRGVRAMAAFLARARAERAEEE